MRLVFAGTPAVAVPSLLALLGGGHEVVTAITREDAPIGRKRVLTPSPVAVAAERAGIPTIKANRLDATATERVADVKPDLGVIVAYGGLVREPLLSLPTHGWVNLHFSLLPRWRGAAPVQHSVLAGDERTGAAVFQLVPELDAGDVFASIERPIGDDETSGDLLAALAGSGAGLLASVVDDIARGNATATPQEGEPTLAPKLTIDDARIRWDAPADVVYARIRAMTPEPGAFTTVNDARLKLLAARSTADGPPLLPGRLAQQEGRVLVGTSTHPIELLTVQPAGKKTMPAADWWRGAGDSEGLTAE